MGFEKTTYLNDGENCLMRSVVVCSVCLCCNFMGWTSSCWVSLRFFFHLICSVTSFVASINPVSCQIDPSIVCSTVFYFVHLDKAILRYFLVSVRML